jgi:hypothetical protein
MGHAIVGGALQVAFRAKIFLSFMLLTAGYNKRKNVILNRRERKQHNNDNKIRTQHQV